MKSLEITIGKPAGKPVKITIRGMHNDYSEVVLQFSDPLPEEKIFPLKIKKHLLRCFFISKYSYKVCKTVSVSSSELHLS
jgi:hypothetical protein